MVIDEAYMAEQKYVNVLVGSLETFQINFLGYDNTVSSTNIIYSVNELLRSVKILHCF